jgi:hypothetical protein
MNTALMLFVYGKYLWMRGSVITPRNQAGDFSRARQVAGGAVQQGEAFQQVAQHVARNAQQTGGLEFLRMPVSTAVE